MKKCVHCGAKLKDRAMVCMKCGALQQAGEQQSVLPETTVPAYTDVPTPVYTEKPVDPVEKEFPVIVAQTRIPASATPAYKLKTNRGLLKFLFLSLITCGIYAIVDMSRVTEDINIIASRYDGKRTMHYCLITFLFSWLTLGIAPLVWGHRMCGRIGNELARRGIAYRFGTGTFWGWGVFGSLIAVGPFIYTHKLLKAMNLLSTHYNING